nr:hypothetical protein BaRGS_009659 [Batillaria attramentaria]
MYRFDDMAEGKVELLTTPLRHNHVTVTHFVAALGLERKIVVHLPGRKHSCAGSDDDDSDELVDWVDRVLAVSRCLAQLVVVDVPKD